MAVWSTQNPTQWVLGTLNIKSPRKEAEHLLPSRAEVKNKWCYTSNLMVCTAQYSNFECYCIPKGRTVHSHYCTYITPKWVTVMVRSIHDQPCVKVDAEDQDQPCTTDP